MYFEEAGPKCTEEVLKLAVARAEEEDLSLVIASNSGDTVCKALGLMKKGVPIVCVTHMVGFGKPGEDEMPREVRQDLKTKGVEVLTTTHVLAGVDRSLRLRFGGIEPPEIIANALRMLGQGTKVCVEIAIMAVDAGLIAHNKPCVAVGGTGQGADTALVITPAHSNQVFDLKVHEVLAKPRNW